ncbi:MAG: hypothetical protein DHS20C05_08280 [Hyphococcus sp.]|nr:MAG: hypothetical protein DHS20C05_08280 [Marinicaulis sp.]
MSLVPQFGFMELMLIAVIALIVVGPKDLPKLMRSAGQFVAKARRLAGEFTSAFDQMARESEMEELRKEIDGLKKDNVFSQTKRELDESLEPLNKDLREEAAGIDKAVSDSGAQTPTAPAPEETNADEENVKP